MNVPKIVVLGGLVMDLIFDVPDWPQIRRAVQASTFVMQPGGKGLNQSVGASRLGAQVSVICNVGQDHLGDLLLSSLEEEGIDYQHVSRPTEFDTDVTAVIIQHGDPGFIGAKMATQSVLPANVRAAETLIKNADVLMATGEIRVDAVRTAFRIAKEHKVTTILNPAPPERLGQSILSLTDYLVPNLWEASELVGETRGGVIAVESIVAKLRLARARNVIITNGESGCWAFLENRTVELFNPFPTTVVDTTGASDAFCAALAVSLGQGLSPSEAITVASAAGALACSAFGASSSMPRKDQVNSLMRKEGIELKLS